MENAMVKPTERKARQAERGALSGKVGGMWHKLAAQNEAKEEDFFSCFYVANI
jgi:hypothetical protein